MKLINFPTLTPPKRAPSLLINWSDVSYIERRSEDVCRVHFKNKVKLDIAMRIQDLAEILRNEWSK